ncbi:hypothetical protein GCM10010191_61020 [Actinomadura vinacea]|uniref:Butirosin biosynthesis protein H N-terminal domain-containing protein n=1 Tax=Actinomadura vinacea TaxID=115336 RepID=A0ABP5WWF2_9ACTN
MHEMTQPTQSGDVRGDLLSCYSTATAGLLRAVGVPDVVVFGTQLFLGVRRAGPIMEFLHYHTPLTGHGELYRVDLHRRGATGPEEAAEAIVRHARETGAVIVTGRTTHLPWIETGGAEPAPHWFLVRPGPPGRVEVDDRFLWTDDAGLHAGFVGSVPVPAIGAYAWSPPPPGPEQASRERWALGDRRDRPSWSEGRPWQWLELTGRHVPGTADLAAVMLARTARARIADPRVAAHGWACGRAAFDALENWLEDGLTDPATYRHNNDFWVASRNRKMVAASLPHVRLPQDRHGALGELGAWAGSTLVPAWTTLVRALHYNARRVATGGRPRPDALAALTAVADLEDHFRTRLDDAL